MKMKLRDCINLHLALCVNEVFGHFEGQMTTPTLIWDVCELHEAFLKELRAAVTTLSFAKEDDDVAQTAWRDKHGEEAKEMTLHSVEVVNYLKSK